MSVFIDSGSQIYWIQKHPHLQLVCTSFNVVTPPFEKSDRSYGPIGPWTSDSPIALLDSNTSHFLISDCTGENVVLIAVEDISKPQLYSIESSMYIHLKILTGNQIFGITNQQNQMMVWKNSRGCSMMQSSSSTTCPWSDSSLPIDTVLSTICDNTDFLWIQHDSHLYLVELSTDACTTTIRWSTTPCIYAAKLHSTTSLQVAVQRTATKWEILLWNETTRSCTVQATITTPFISLSQSVLAYACPDTLASELAISTGSALIFASKSAIKQHEQVHVRCMIWCNAWQGCPGSYLIALTARQGKLVVLVYYHKELICKVPLETKLLEEKNSTFLMIRKDNGIQVLMVVGSTTLSFAFISTETAFHMNRPLYHPQTLERALANGLYSFVYVVLQHLATCITDYKQSSYTLMTESTSSSCLSVSEPSMMIELLRFFWGEDQEKKEKVVENKNDVHWSLQFDDVPPPISKTVGERTFKDLETPSSTVLDWIRTNTLPNLNLQDHETLLWILSKLKNVPALGKKFPGSNWLMCISEGITQAHPISWEQVAWIIVTDQSSAVWTRACTHPPLTWTQWKALKLPMWLTESSQWTPALTKLAQTTYVQTKNHRSCTLYYILLKKTTLLSQLYRRANEVRVADLLMQDFSTDRWKKAAIKNAQILQSKRETELSIAFYLLGKQIAPALSLARKLDPSGLLALLIARTCYVDDDVSLRKYCLENDTMSCPWESFCWKYKYDSKAAWNSLREQSTFEELDSRIQLNVDFGKDYSISDKAQTRLVPGKSNLFLHCRFGKRMEMEKRPLAFRIQLFRTTCITLESTLQTDVALLSTLLTVDDDDDEQENSLRSFLHKVYTRLLLPDSVMDWIAMNMSSSLLHLLLTTLSTSQCQSITATIPSLLQGLQYCVQYSTCSISTRRIMSVVVSAMMFGMLIRIDALDSCCILRFYQLLIPHLDIRHYKKDENNSLCFECAHHEVSKGRRRVRDDLPYLKKAWHQIEKESVMDITTSCCFHVQELLLSACTLVSNHLRSLVPLYAESTDLLISWEEMEYKVSKILPVECKETACRYQDILLRLPSNSLDVGWKVQSIWNNTMKKKELESIRGLGYTSKHGLIVGCGKGLYGIEHSHVNKTFADTAATLHVSAIACHSSAPVFLTGTTKGVLALWNQEKTTVQCELLARTTGPIHRIRINAQNTHVRANTMFILILIQCF